MLLVILRLIHIITGIAWLGLGAVAAWVVHPVAAKTDEKGNSLLRIFYGYSSYNKIFPITAIITTLVGLVLWGMQADGMDLAGFSTTGSMVMGVGVLFGLLAFGHGAGATGRFSGNYAKLARAVEEGDTSKSQELAETRKKLFLHSNISAILTVIATVAMASARYL